jgi:hypothetical protein
MPSGFYQVAQVGAWIYFVQNPFQAGRCSGPMTELDPENSLSFSDGTAVVRRQL